MSLDHPPNLMLRTHVTYPRHAEVEKIYLITVDLERETADEQPADSEQEWPYPEDIHINCLLDTAPFFNFKPVDDPTIVVHRFGGSYGPARFLLTANQKSSGCTIRVILADHNGIPFATVPLEGIKITAASEQRDASAPEHGDAAADHRVHLPMSASYAPSAQGAAQARHERGAPFDEEWLPVPHDPATFIGRPAELRWLSERLRQSTGTLRVIALTGQSGIGKTALAGKVIRSLRREGYFPDGVAVDVLQGLTDISAVLPRILGRFDAFRRQPAGADIVALAEVAGYLLNDRQTLIVLDDLDPQLDIEQMLRSLQSVDVTVLLIARALSDETRSFVDAALPLRPLRPSESLEVFTESFQIPTQRALTRRELPAARRIVETLEGNALAIRLAGALAGSSDQIDLAQLAEELAQPVASVKSPGEDIAPAVARVVVRSLEHLPEQTHRLLVACAGFATEEWGVEAAMALAADHRIAAPLEQIEILVRRALLQRNQFDPFPKRGDRVRLRMQPIIRAFAQAAFMDWPEQRQYVAHQSIAEYFVRYMSPPLSRADEHLLDADKRNIAGALDWAQQHERHKLFLHLCVGISPFWYHGWFTRESLKYLPLAIHAGDKLRLRKNEPHEQKVAADVEFMYGKILRRVGQVREAELTLRANLDHRRRLSDLSDPRDYANTQQQLGVAIRILGRPDEARDYIEQALETHLRLSDPSGQSDDYGELGRIAQTQGKLEDAARYFQQSLDLARAVDYRAKVGANLTYLGQVARARGELEHAQELLGEALGILIEVGNRRGEGVALSQLGRVARIRGELDQADNCFVQSLHIRREVQDHRGEGEELGNLGRVARMRGRHEVAEQYFRESLRIAREVEDRRGEAIVINQLGQIALTRSEYAEAEAYFRQSLRIRLDVADRRGEGADRGYLARIAMRKGDLDEANRLLEESGRIAREVEDHHGEVIVLLLRGRWAEAAHQPAEAKARFEEARALAEEWHIALAIPEALMRLGKLLIETGEDRDRGCALLAQAIRAYARMELADEQIARDYARRLNCSPPDADTTFG